ncbi:hypothetical protein [Phaeobacter sp. JH204B]|uniref:hypothetical protein n=1 Tax=Phaeobacter sp. JH204B TaxID=3112503 RepID=UPI003A899DEB
MGVLFNRALLAHAAASQGGGGATWSMTAGQDVPATGTVGYSIFGSGAGSISNEPIDGITLENQLSDAANSTFRLRFVGDNVATLSQFSELVIDGSPFAITDWQTTSGDTYANFTSTFPDYTSGQTYACELR